MSPQNASRITRALFEIALKRGWVSVATKLLSLCKCIDKRMWPFEHPLAQFGTLDPQIIQKLEQKEADMDTLADLQAAEIGELIRHVRLGSVVKGFISKFPKLDLQVSIQPITRYLIFFYLILFYFILFLFLFLILIFIFLKYIFLFLIFIFLKYIFFSFKNNFACSSQN